MSINLVSIIMQFLSPEVISKIASSLSVDRSAATKATTAAVPGILATLAGAASTPDGSRKIFDAVSKQSPGILDELSSMVGGAGQKTLVDSGTSMLSSILGGSALSGLAGAVAKFAGIGGEAGSSLLGALAPVVMGALNQQKAAGGLDASSLAQMLTSQKANITAALPAGFSDILSSTGLLAGFGSGASNTAEAARTAARSAAAMADRTAAQTSGGMPGWLRWALPLVAVAAVGWWFLGRHAPTVVEQSRNVATQTTQSAQGLAAQASTVAAQAKKSLQDVTAGGLNVGTEVQSAVGGLTDALKGVSDAASARAILPKLQGAAAQLDKVQAVVNQIPANGRSALATLMGAVRPSLEELFTKVLAIPGVAEIAKPTIDGIRANLDALARA